MGDGILLESVPPLRLSSFVARAPASALVRSSVLLMSFSVDWTSEDEHEISEGLRWGAGAGGGGVICTMSEKFHLFVVNQMVKKEKYIRTH